ncbi:MAG: dTMP kinase [bacterium]|nr:dTMP kinase [bacterium]
MLIEIEGIDGVGKSTQCRHLKAWLQSLGYHAIIVKEPGGTAFGALLKRVIASRVPRDRKALMFAFLASKSQLYREIIAPALALERQVIADRGRGSFLSYHSVMTDLSIADLTALVDSATGGIKPSITLLLDAPPDLASMRNQGRKRQSRFDMLGKMFFARQREKYLELARFSTNWHVIDASRTIEDVKRKIRAKLSEFFPLH